MAKSEETPKNEQTPGQKSGSAEQSGQQPSQRQAAEAASTQQPQQQQSSVRVDDENVTACYANFCRVSSTPEELILDLGLNPNPYATGEQVIPVSQRIILNHYTAKRLLNALTMALQRHEQAFGVLETDIRKRVRTTTT